MPLCNVSYVPTFTVNHFLEANQENDSMTPYIFFIFLVELVISFLYCHSKIVVHAISIMFCCNLYVLDVKDTSIIEVMHWSLCNYFSNCDRAVATVICIDLVIWFQMQLESVFQSLQGLLVIFMALWIHYLAARGLWKARSWISLENSDKSLATIHFVLVKLAPFCLCGLPCGFMPEYVCVPCARFVLVGIFLDQVALLVKSKESFFPFNLDAAINSYGITWLRSSSFFFPWI